MSTTVVTVGPTASSPLPDTDAQPAPLEAPSLPYECSLFSCDIDLSLRDDLSASVQDYLMRIADELQQLSKWTAACQSRIALCEQQRDCVSPELETGATTTAALLLAQTETRLLRGEMQRLSQDILQRAATQLAYVQNSIRSDSSDQLAEVERRIDAKLRALSQQTAALVESARADCALQALVRRLDVHQERLTTLEKRVVESPPVNAKPQQREMHEVVAPPRRLEHIEATMALHLHALNTKVAELLAAARDTQTQLVAKLQVMREDMQQQRDDLSRKMQQLSRSLHRAGAAEMPRPASSLVMAVGASALRGHEANGECFLHAKAALAPRNEDSLLPFKPVTPVPPRGMGAYGGVGAIRPQPLPQVGSMEAALRIHSSILSQPVGHEEEEIHMETPLIVSSPGNRLSPRQASLRVTSATTATTTTRRPQAPRPETAK